MAVYLFSALSFMVWLAVRPYSRKKTWLAALVFAAAAFACIWTFAVWHEAVQTAPEDKMRLWLLLGCHIVFLTILVDYMLYFLNKIPKK